MNEVMILTATYNHPEKLYELYQSLCKQENKGFSWLIVDDGSAEETKIMVKRIIAENNINVHYLFKKNGGKASAINEGLEYISRGSCKFVLFVDDDEKILSNGIQIVIDYYKKYVDSRVGVIHFNRLNEKGAVIANPIFDEDHVMTCQMRKRKGFSQDGYTGYYVEKLGTLRFPRFEGEKYVGPSVLFMMLCNCGYEMVWAYKAIGQTEYLEAGITKQGRKLRVKNPHAMYLYCLLLQNKDSGLALRFIYSVYGYAYLYHGEITEKEVTEKIVTNNRLLSVARPIGFILSKYWKTKYKL